MPLSKPPTTGTTATRQSTSATHSHPSSRTFGSDTPTNAVAVCPNCHRQLHFSENARAYRETLYGKVAELVRE
ncbi:hypothetical protein DF146_02160 [Burkholderia cenocepacia]|uniref:HNH endonuclease signature motif containing protein n=1 Tax=Burkholderia cenocepacia TaxID=95486 RepID=UPI000F5A15A8|nr:HNH endonuclease signature motif containing protein [Burkholderia cenocepacia]RQU00661.1 hypothetical protein DF165_05960 [Burkholderia cenocepacia]RQU60185.1 hypothetical protein DF146_02160 [Burkholderia cenocepacia]